MYSGVAIWVHSQDSVSCKSAPQQWLPPVARLEATFSIIRDTPLQIETEPERVPPKGHSSKMCGFRVPC